MAKKFRYECAQCGSVQEFDQMPRAPPQCCGVLMKRVASV